MRYVTSKERQEIGLQKFVPIHYKNELKEGNLKTLIKAYSMCLLMLIILLVVFPGLRELILVFVYFLLAATLLGTIIVTISLIKGKKRKIKDNLVNVEHIFEDKYESIANYKGGSVDRGVYDYSDILKIVESEEFFYIYLKNYSTVPLDKQSIKDIEEFIAFIKSKNVLIKELKKNENK